MLLAKIERRKQNRIKYEAFIWKLLVTAHTNGLRGAAEAQREQAQAIESNAALIAMLQLPNWPTAT